MYYKTNKSNMAKQTVSKQIHFKRDAKDQPNGASNWNWTAEAQPT